MKKIKVSDIAGGAGFKVKKGTIVHLQEAYSELGEAIVRSRIGNGYSSSVAYLLYGLVNSTPGGLTYTLGAGSIFYNGEIFPVDAVTVVCSGGEVPVASIVTTNYTGLTADPVEFTDGNTYDVHEIRKITFTNAATGSGLFDFSAINNYLGSADYIDVSSSVTLHANLSGSKTVRVYKNGDVVISLNAALNTTIPVNDNLLTGLPNFPGIHYIDINHVKGSGPYTYGSKRCGIAATILQAVEEFNTSTIDNISMYFTYKL